MTQVEQAAYDVCAALVNAGSHPDYHNRMLSKLKEEWPVLFKALVELVESHPGIGNRIVVTSGSAFVGRSKDPAK